MSFVRTTRHAAALALALGGGATLDVAAQDMYRCPGNDYKNTISAKEAAAQGCQRIEGAPITVIQSPRPRPVPAAAPSGGGTAAPAANAAPASVGPASARVDPAAQRARDSDARRILETELRSEEERLAVMQKEFNNGEPERQGNERNYQKYAERVAEMKAAIARKESDIAAIRREMQKLPK